MLLNRTLVCSNRSSLTQEIGIEPRCCNERLQTPSVASFRREPHALPTRNNCKQTDKQGAIFTQSTIVGSKLKACLSYAIGLVPRYCNSHQQKSNAALFRWVPWTLTPGNKHKQHICKFKLINHFVLQVIVLLGKKAWLHDRTSPCFCTNCDPFAGCKWPSLNHKLWAKRQHFESHLLGLDSVA